MCSSLFLRASPQELLLLSHRCQRQTSVDLGVAGNKVGYTNVEYSQAVLCDPTCPADAGVQHSNWADHQAGYNIALGIHHAQAAWQVRAKRHGSHAHDPRQVLHRTLEHLRAQVANQYGYTELAA